MPEDPVPPVPFITPSPMAMRPKPARRGPDPDRFLQTAKQLVTDNYNRTRNATQFPELGTDAFHVVWFTKTMGHWKAVVESQQAARLSWTVTYNDDLNEAYIIVWKKLTMVKVAMGEDT